ncbi:MAG: lysostaphin resistance A-like protein [Acidobacteriota bacterium]
MKDHGSRDGPFPEPFSFSGASVRAGVRELVLLVAAALVLTLLLVPVVALALPWTAFHRLMTRTFFLCLLVPLLIRRGPPRRWSRGLQRMGLRGPHPFQRALLGAAGSVLLLAALLAVSWLAGGRQVDVRSTAGWTSHLVKAILAGIGVGLVEEVVWRGYLRSLVGAVWSSLAYAAVHYFRPLAGSAPAGGPYEPWLAVRRFPEMVQSWGDPRTVLLGMASLFLFGMALCRLRQRSGTLLLGIGAHGGFVFAIEMYRDLISPVATGSAWIFGGTRLHDGILGLLALLFFFWATGHLGLPGSRSRNPAGQAPRSVDS